MIECPNCRCSFELPKLICKRCEHSWLKRTGKNPKVCPKCKSPYWDRDRIKTREILFPNFKDWIKRYKKNLKCSECDEDKPAVLTFHHLKKENKKFPISDGLYHTKKEVKEEIKKCVVLCFNCHRIKHIQT